MREKTKDKEKEKREYSIPMSLLYQRFTTGLKLGFYNRSYTAIYIDLKYNPSCKNRLSF